MRTKHVLQLLLALFLAACGPVTVVLPTSIPSSPVETFTPVSDLPDLIISSVSLNIQGNTGGNCVTGYGTYELHVAVQNLGTGPAYNISVVETSTGTNLTIGELKPFDVFELYFPASSPTGGYSFAVDPQNLITERDESNNVFSYLQPTPTPPVICTATLAPVDGPVASLTPVMGEPTPSTTPLIVWQSNTSPCEIVSFWPDRMSYGPCPSTAGPITIEYPTLDDYFSRYSIWTKAYAPFIAQTRIGTVTFNGSGYVIATPAEQRMMAEWAARMLSDVPFESPTYGSGTFISKQFSGDSACYSMAIYRDGHYLVESCLAGYSYPAPTGYLDANELVYLYRWNDALNAFQERTPNSVLSFMGVGPTLASAADKISIDTMMRNVEFRARQAASGGGLPPAALAAQRLLMSQLGISSDQVQVKTVESLNYADTCLGAPRPDEICTQIPTPGYRIQLVVQGMLYEFHTDPNGYELRQYGDPVQAPPGAG